MLEQLLPWYPNKWLFLSCFSFFACLLLALLTIFYFLLIFHFLYVTRCSLSRLVRLSDKFIRAKSKKRLHFIVELELINDFRNANYWVSFLFSFCFLKSSKRWWRTTTSTSARLPSTILLIKPEPVKVQLLWKSISEDFRKFNALSINLFKKLFSIIDRLSSKYLFWNKLMC